MAIALERITAALGAYAGLTFTYSHEVVDGPPGRFLVVVISQINFDVTGVTYNGVSMTEQVSRNQSFDGVYIFTLQDPDVGIHDVVITSDSGGDCATASYTFHGVHTENPVDASGGATGTTSDPATVTLTDRRVGQFIVDCVASQSLALTAGAGQIERYNTTITVGQIGGSSTEPGVDGSIEMSWSSAVFVNWAIVAIAMNPEPREVEGGRAQFGPQVFVRQPAGVAY